MGDTNVLAKGFATSEGKLAVILGAAGVALGTIGPTVIELSNAFPHAKWLAIAAMAVGWGTSLLTFLGYAKNRSTVKAAAISTDTPPMGNAANLTRSP